MAAMQGWARSTLLFDYATYTYEEPVSSSASSPPGTATASIASSSPNSVKTNIKSASTSTSPVQTAAVKDGAGSNAKRLGVPVGGAVGGVAFVSLCIYLAIYTRRRKAQDRARHAPRLESFDRQPYRHRSLRPGTINIERAYAVRCVEDSAPQSETLRSETDPRADYDSLVRELQRMREEIREKATVAHYTPNPTPVTAIIDGGVEAGLRSDIAILRGGLSQLQAETEELRNLPPAYHR
ncbi:hypothetical protein C8Q72DRAFT_14292 [Fomitopsis betulina]|nr:hypothetical protein C8Q72DRAFT_14292 [Fomitopsis betulina]